MSWSVSGVGKPAPVAAKLANDFARITYLGPEESAIKAAVAEVVAKALAANTRKDVVLQVSASGSGSASADGSQQSVALNIQQIYGFTE